MPLTISGGRGPPKPYHCFCGPTPRHHRIIQITSYLLGQRLLLFPGGVLNTLISGSRLSGALLNAVTQNGCSYKGTDQSTHLSSGALPHSHLDSSWT